MKSKGIGKKIIPLVVSCIMVVSQSSAFAQTSTTSKAQQKLDPKYTWNLSDIYKDKSAFDVEYDKLLNLLPKFKEYQGKLGDSDNLLTVLKLNEQAGIMDSKLYWYAHFMQDLDIENSVAADLCSKTEAIDNELTAATAYIEPEIVNLPEEKLKACVSNPQYTDYKHYIETRLKQKSHILTKDNEELLAQVSKTSSDPENIYKNAIRGDWTAPTIKDPNGKTIKLDDAGFSLAMENPDRNFRKKAYEVYFSSLNRLKNTCAATLQASVNKDETFAKARKYNSGLDEALAADYVPESVFNGLIDTVNKNLPSLHKYYDLRRRAMKLDKVRGYDMSLPLVDQKVAQNMKYPIDKAYLVILEALKPLGEEYVGNIKYGFENRWLDVYPGDKKATGGYNLGLYGVHPFVLLNYDESIDEVSTIAHEMGHAMHAVYSEKNQKFINASAPIFTAEVASTANELIFMDYMINNAKTDDEKLYLINKQIDNIRGTIYTQVLYSEFEKTIHNKVKNGESLSSKELNKIWIDLLKKYNGPAYETLQGQGNVWMEISHFYSQFYVYKYATSMSASYELVKQMKEDKTGEATKRYIEFLSAGDSDYPIEVLKKAGVDLTSPQPVENLLKYFDSLVNQMESILKKQGKIK